MCNHFNKMKER